MSKITEWTDSNIEAAQPRVILTAYGRYLAVSPHHVPLRLAVVADTEADAAEEYRLALRHAREILLRPFPKGRSG